MAFVKLDTRILDSTLWTDRDVTQIFITALLMAEPFEAEKPLPQIAVRTLEPTGFQVPPGWYGLVPTAGAGIIRRALMEQEAGYAALEKLGVPDAESRSNEHDGRRLVRVDGGYVVLNFMKYRDKDHTGADRQRRLRERRKSLSNAVTLRDDNAASHADADADADADAEKNNPNPSPESLFDLEAKPENPFDIRKVFAYFCDQADKTKAYTLTKKRKAQGEARWLEALKIACGDEKEAKTLVKKAIDGLCENKFMRERSLLDWDQVFRSEENFTKWIEKYEHPEQSRA